jgi:hypothetical protein
MASGKRFLMVKPSTEADGEISEELIVEEPREIIIVLNWFEELKDRVPVE